MRHPISLLLLVLLTSTQAFEWRSEIFNCSANLPDSPGWKVIEAPQTPGITIVVAMQNAAKQAVFGINIVENLPGTDLTNPAVRGAIEDLLRKFSYQAIGNSVVKIGGLNWLQYPVQSGSGAERVSGVLRFTSAGGRIFSVTALRGGGQEAAQDLELQQAAASFRILEGVPVAKTAAADSAPVLAPSPPAETRDPKPPAAPGDNRKTIWLASAGIIVLLVLFKIIGGGKTARD